MAPVSQELEPPTIPGRFTAVYLTVRTRSRAVQLSHGYSEQSSGLRRRGAKRRANIVRRGAGQRQMRSITARTSRLQPSHHARASCVATTPVLQVQPRALGPRTMRSMFHMMQAQAAPPPVRAERLKPYCADGFAADQIYNGDAASARCTVMNR